MARGRRSVRGKWGARWVLRLVCLAGILAARAGSTQAQESVSISLPATVSFTVTDVSVSASAGPSVITFSSAALTTGHALRVSLKADGDLTPPTGPAIPASNVSWTTSSVTQGVGSNGTLSKTVYNQVYQSQANPTPGGFNLSWTLSAPGTPRNAGSHQATLRWKVEAITP